MSKEKSEAQVLREMEQAQAKLKELMAQKKKFDQEKKNARKKFDAECKKVFGYKSDTVKEYLDFAVKATDLISREMRALGKEPRDYEKYVTEIEKQEKDEFDYGV